MSLWASPLFYPYVLLPTPPSVRRGWWSRKVVDINLCYGGNPEESEPAVKEAACQHCGDSIRTKRPDLRKWCDRCRDLKAILALRDRAHKCVVCGHRYYAISGNSARASMRLCPSCSGTPAGEHRDTAPCAFCDNDQRLIPGVALCYVCAASAENEKLATQVVQAAAKKLAAVAHG